MPDVLNFNGTYWYSLKGPKGDPGTPGKKGEQGPPGNQGPAGAPGEVIIPGLLIDLSNENQPVATDYNGENGNYDYAKTSAKVYDNGIDVSADWTFQFPIVSDPGVHGGPINNELNTFHVTDLVGIDTGAVKFTATKAGSPLLSADFIVYKVKGGADGAPATVAMLESSAAAVNKDNAGVYTPPIVLFSAFSITGNSPRIPYAGRFKIEVQSSVSSQWNTVYTSAVDEITTNFAVPPDIKLIKITLYHAGGTTDVWDSENIPITKDGRPGADGAPGASGIVIDLDNQTHTVPAEPTGAVTDWTGCRTKAFVYEGAVDVSHQWSFDVPVFTGGLNGISSEANRTFQANALTADVGTATFRATKAGASPITAVFTVTKVFGGADGTPATVYRLNTDGIAVIRRDKQGTLIPAFISISVDSITAGVATKIPFSIIGWRKTTAAGEWEEQYRTLSTQTINWDLNHLNMGNGTIQYKYSVARAGAYGPPWLDEEVIPVVSDGQDGPAGPPGAGLALNLDNDNHGVPTDKDGNNGNFTGAWSNAALYSSGVDISSSATWETPIVVTGTGTLSIANGGRTAIVTSMSTDVLSVRFRASFLGTLYDAIFTVQKVRAGADGTSPKVYEIDTDGISVIKKNNYNGVPSFDPANLSIRVKETVGSTTNFIPFFLSFYGKTTAGGAWTLVVQSGSDQEFKIAFPLGGYLNVVQFKAVVTHHGSWTTPPLDTEIYPVVVDGNDGPPGAVGPAGPLGNRGPGVFSKQMEMPPNIVNAATQAIYEFTGGPPFIRDVMTLYNGRDWSITGVWTGTTWEPITQYMSGTVVLDGTLSANALAADTILGRRVIVGSFPGDQAGSIQSNGFIPNQQGWRIDGAGAEFQNVKVRGDIIVGTGNLIQNSAAEQIWANTETLGNAQFAILDDTNVGCPWFKKVFNVWQNVNQRAYLKFYKEFQISGQTVRFDVSPGEKYQISAYIYSQNCNCGVTVDFYDAAGNLFTNCGELWNDDTGRKGGGRDLLKDYNRVFKNFVVPSGAVSAVVVFVKEAAGGNTQAGITNVFFSKIPDIRVTDPIPWSPGGVTLVNTQSVAINAITNLSVAKYGVYSIARNSYVEFPVLTIPNATVKESRKMAIVTFYGEVECQPSDSFLYYGALYRYTDQQGMWMQLEGFASQKVVPSTNTPLWLPCWVSRIVNLADYSDVNGQSPILFQAKVFGDAMGSAKQVRNAYLSVHEFKR